MAQLSGTNRTLGHHPDPAQVHPKFAEKAIRKKKVGRDDDLLLRMTDLCGRRVITQTLARAALELRGQVISSKRRGKT